MRLSQVSKELGLKSGEIRSILKAAHIEVDENPNAKLSEQAIELLKKESLKKSIKLDADTEDWSQSSKQKEAPKEVESMKELLDEKEIEATSMPEEVEHIHPEIPEITGPKVLDKIELPDYIEKEKELREKRKAEKKEKEAERRKAREERMKSRSTSKKYISEEERERREKKRKDRERREREKFLKEQRRLNYLKNVEQKAPQNKKPKDEENQEQLITDSLSEPQKQNTVPRKEASKSIFARFFRWLYHGE